MSRRLLIGLVSLAIVLLDPRPAHAGGTQHDLQLEISTGSDSNPLELSAEAPLTNGGPSRARFTQLALDARRADQWNPRVGYFIAATGRGRVHSSSLEAADTAQGRAEAGLGFVLVARGERRLSLALRGSYDVDRSTFVDPATGEVYLLTSDPNMPALAIPDRFDADTRALNLDLRLRTSRRLLLLFDTRVEREDFVVDYDDVSTLEPLDNRSLTFHPGARIGLSERVRLDVTAEWSRLSYDRLSSLEEDASVAAGSRRRYRMAALRAALRVEPSDRWSFSLGAGGADRRDLHAGYYDGAGANLFAALVWAPLETTRLTLHLSESAFDYERAKVSSANGDRRGGETLRAAAGVEHDLGAHVTAFVEGGAVRSDSRDPLYTYDRHWALTGLRLKL